MLAVVEVVAAAAAADLPCLVYRYTYFDQAVKDFDGWMYR